MRRLHFAAVAALATAAGVVSSSGCGPDAKERCAALVKAPCPSGQVNREDGPEYCEPRYEGECSGEWDDYVSCALEKPTCATHHADGTETGGVSPCFEVELKAY